MSKLYLKLILAGRKTFDEVPTNYQAEVKNLLIEKVNSGDSTAKKYFEEKFKEQEEILNG